MKPLADRFGRTVNYLRISLTQRCNYSCFFCHHEGEQQEGPEMTLEEIENLVRAASKRGIRRVKLTGGEALLRDDLLDIVKSLAPLVDDLSLTTNGSRLEEMASELKDAGLERVNVSLHTLNPATFARITGRDNLEAVKRGIQSAVEVGLNPVKINMTILKDINENEINAMMDFACRTGTILQLIELQYMPGENDRTWQRYWVDLEAAEQQLESKASEIRKRSLHARKQYTLLLDHGEVVVEVVRPTHNSSFCDSCTRLRMTSDGRLKPCLLRHDNLIDIRALLGDENPRSSVDGALVRAVETREPYWRGEDST
ncbi:MAG: GTP 3',8-cyclase MoaA [Candidatus Thorarchaeota archaeon]|nr:MAG: GTP 3',8-cyclase MoaA [Candidatus Thorarchaeota archaeon]